MAQCYFCNSFNEPFCIQITFGAYVHFNTLYIARMNILRSL